MIGTFGTAVVAFVLTDFLMWFTHWARHKVPTFWYFHAVHHAAPTLNALTDNRVHFVEAIIHATIVVLPARWLGLDGPAATALAIATTYFTAWTHTAVRTNMGPLRWIIVTPQSHRVHHSFAPEHLDTNFATVFSFWDIIFRTQYKGWDEYPATGIADPSYPHERAATPGALLGAYARQNVYPFTQIARDIGKFRRAPYKAPLGDDDRRTGASPSGATRSLPSAPWPRRCSPSPSISPRRRSPSPRSKAISTRTSRPSSGYSAATRSCWQC